MEVKYWSIRDNIYFKPVINVWCNFLKSQNLYLRTKRIEVTNVLSLIIAHLEHFSSHSFGFNNSSSQGRKTSYNYIKLKDKLSFWPISSSYTREQIVIERSESVVCGD